MAKNKGNKDQAAPAVAPQEIIAEPGFFGSVIKPGQKLVWENETEEMALQLTSAALGPKVTTGRSTLVVSAKEYKIALCTLIPEKVEQCTLTHVFTPMDGPVTFHNDGVNEIHLTGMVDIEDDQGDDEDDHHHGHDHDHAHAHGHDDSDDDSDDDDDEGMMTGMYSDSDDGSDVMIFGGEGDDDSEDSEDEDEEGDEERFEVIEERVHGDAGEKKKAMPKKDAKEAAPAKKEATPVKKDATPAKKEKKEATPVKKNATPVKKDTTPAKKETTPAKKEAAAATKKEEKKDEAATGKKRAALTDAADASKKKAKVTRLYKGVTIEEVALGKGQPIGRGKKASILYRGKLTNGKQFDAQQNRKTPFVFRHGVGDVIKGMDIGIEGMRPGGKRTVTIPSHLGYGKSGAPPSIPGNSTLVFEIELL